jgi:hypothetical protein
LLEQTNLQGKLLHMGKKLIGTKNDYEFVEEDDKEFPDRA